MEDLYYFTPDVEASRQNIAREARRLGYAVREYDAPVRRPMRIDLNGAYWDVEYVITADFLEFAFQTADVHVANVGIVRSLCPVRFLSVTFNTATLKTLFEVLAADMRSSHGLVAFDDTLETLLSADTLEEGFERYT